MKKLSKALKQIREEQSFGSGLMFGLLTGGAATDAIGYWLVLVFMASIAGAWIFNIDQRVINTLEHKHKKCGGVNE